MKRIFLCVMMGVLTVTTLKAQGEKLVAILEVVDQTGKLDPSIKMMVRGGLTTAITNTPGYKGYDRATVASILGEQSFQRTGNVSPEQIKKLGKMTGADYVLIAEAMKTFDGMLYITTKIVNVESAEITESAENSSELGTEAIRKACRELADQLLGTGGSNLVSSNKNAGSVRFSEQNYTENAWGLNMEMVYVEGGSFVMGCMGEGCDCYSNERPIHRVNLKSFYIGATEVTQAQWEKVMGTSITLQRNKANGVWSFRGTGPDYPMYFVSWEEAKDFCQELSRKTGKTYTLPTEAQWEFAARGGNKKDEMKYSGSYIVDDVAWYTGNSGSGTQPVKRKKPNGLGLYDMNGNVFEWCMDWYASSYNMNDTQDPAGPSSGSSRVCRGGSWISGDMYCRVSTRYYISPLRRRDNVGFRVVMIP